MASFSPSSAIFFFFFAVIDYDLLFYSVSSCNVSTIYIFGDSILDAGNNVFIDNCSVQANFPPYGQDFFHRPTGRFTNGRTVADFIAEEMGTKMQLPYQEVDMSIKNGTLNDYPPNGINFASAGSGVFNETNREKGVTSLELQLQQFEYIATQKKVDKKLIQQALYILETGSNDIFFYFFIPEDQRPTPDAFVSAMLSEYEKGIRKIYEIGARRIAIFSLGPVGCIPARLMVPGGAVGSCHSLINEMVLKFNSGLDSMVSEIPNILHGAIAVYGATFDVVNAFLQFPHRYGFENVSGACCGGGTLRGLSQCGTDDYELCTNAKQYVFWDFFHPTEHAYKLIFKAFWNGKTRRIRPINLKSLVNTTLHVY